MTTPSRARLGAEARARLISAVKNSDNKPDAVAFGDVGIWRNLDPTPAAPQSVGAGALFVEYLIGFHGLHPDDATFEAASIPLPERRTRAEAALYEIRAAISHRHARQIEHNRNPSQHP